MVMFPVLPFVSFTALESCCQLVISETSLRLVFSLSLLSVFVVLSFTLYSYFLSVCKLASTLLSCGTASVSDTVVVSFNTTSPVMLSVSVISSDTSLAFTTPTNSISSVIKSIVFLIVFIFNQSPYYLIK